MNLKAMDPIVRRELAMKLIELNMSESDDAHDAYSDAFDALDRTVTVDVFEDEFGNPRDIRAEQIAAMREAYGNDCAKEMRA